MCRIFYFDKKNSGKGALNPLGWSETRKTEIYPPVFYPNPKYTRPVFYPNPYTPDPYLTCPPELTGLDACHSWLSIIFSNFFIFVFVFFESENLIVMHKASGRVNHRRLRWWRFMNQGWIARLQWTRMVRTEAQNDKLGTKIYRAHIVIYKLIIKLQGVQSQSNNVQNS